jgi:hypothetical protein
MWQVLPREELGVLPARLLELLHRIVIFGNWKGPGRITWDEMETELTAILHDL